MGKKNRKVSKSKRDKANAKSKRGENTEKSNPKFLQIDPNVLKDLTKDLKDVFRFQNGDVYVGQFAVTGEGGVVRSGRGRYWAVDGSSLSVRWEDDVLVEAERVSYPDGSWYWSSRILCVTQQCSLVAGEGGVVRSGRGRYWAVDGSSLSGRWEDDVLVEAERVSYPDGSWYSGALEAGRYSGPGTYWMPTLGALKCDFLQGRPLGLVTLSDHEDQEWQGHAGAGTLTLLPRNHLFDSEDAWCRAASDKESLELRKSSGSRVEPPNTEDTTG